MIFPMAVSPDKVHINLVLRDSSLGIFMVQSGEIKILVKLEP
jgi:hypothetical protein